MSGGKISGNTASASSYYYYSYGGGIYVGGGAFTMSGGKISGNTSSSSSYGGGVYVDFGTFKKMPVDGSNVSGIIYGSDAATGLKNTASNGHAVYVYVNNRKRNATAGENVILDSTMNGSAGGWE
jgi:hypothetical protein